MFLSSYIKSILTHSLSHSHTISVQTYYSHLCGWGVVRVFEEVPQMFLGQFAHPGPKRLFLYLLHGKEKVYVRTEYNDNVIIMIMTTIIITLIIVIILKIIIIMIIMVIMTMKIIIKIILLMIIMITIIINNNNTINNTSGASGSSHLAL